MSRKSAANTASSIFSTGNSEEDLKRYLKDKNIIDTLSSQGIQYIQRISETEITVSAGKPKINAATQHAQDNLAQKADRAEMTVEKAQSFVDNALLTLYQQNRNALKFLARDGYAVLNMDHDLVTAVPQKWRKKYDKYLE